MNGNTVVLFVVILFLSLISLACVSTTQISQPTYTELPTYTPYPTYTPIPTNTSTATSTPTSTLTPSPTNTSTSTLSPTPMRTSTPTSTPTRTPRPTNTLPPTRTPIPAVRLEDIYDNLQNMTAFQFNQYKTAIAGKTVRESIDIGNVDDKGRIIVHGPWSPWLFNVSDFCVVVTGVPVDVAASLSGGESVYLEATINRLVGDYNYFINCENTLVLYYVNIYH